MHDLPQLILDLGLILGAAGVVTLLFKWLKQPLVLGYIIAGFFVSPHFRLFPSIAEAGSISTWADIGVIFLLFSLGLEFSFKKLIKVGGTAAITAIIGVSTTLCFGYLIGKLLHWNTMDALFMGGILAISSTAIIIRAYEGMGLKTKRFAELVLGVLIIEDLFAVVLLVLLSTVAVSQQFSGIEMIESVLKLLFFLVLWFLSGIFLIPTFLKATKKLMNDETMLIVSIAMCFGMVFLAAKAGFSSALGAFIMGSLLSETFQGARIEHLMRPVKDLFAAVFFVSVGMMIDPAMMGKHLLPIGLGVLVMLVCKPFFATLGAIISGQSLKTSVRAGMSLSQIGEFSFIIATLGLTLQVTSSFLYPIAVAISVITAFTTPYMVRLSDPMQIAVDRWLPDNWRKRLQNYSTGAQSIREVSDWRRILRAYIQNTVGYSVILLTIIVVMMRYVQPALEQYEWGSAVTELVGLTLMAPFLWALAARRTETEAFGKLWLQKRFKGPLLLMEISRIAISLLLIGFMLDQFLSTTSAIMISLGVAVVLAIFSKRIQSFYGRIETRFIANLNQKENMEKEKSAPHLAPWDAHISLFQVSADSPLAGKSLLELQLRENYGVNVAMIERGSRMIVTPPRSAQLFPGDELSVIGTDEQLEKFKNFIEQVPDIINVNKIQQRQDVGLKKLVLSEQSALVGKSIRESGLRERSKGIIVGIERDGERMLNPESTVTFEADDIVWMVGNKKRLRVVLNEEKAKE